MQVAIFTALILIVGAVAAKIKDRLNNKTYTEPISINHQVKLNRLRSGLSELEASNKLGFKHNVFSYYESRGATVFLDTLNKMNTVFGWSFTNY